MYDYDWKINGMFVSIFFAKVQYYLEVVLLNEIELNRVLSLPLICASVSSVMCSSTFLS
jgi:hypothetical protein